MLSPLVVEYEGYIDMPVRDGDNEINGYLNIDTILEQARRMESSGSILMRPHHLSHVRRLLLKMHGTSMRSDISSLNMISEGGLMLLESPGYEMDTLMGHRVSLKTFNEYITEMVTLTVNSTEPVAGFHDLTYDLDIVGATYGHKERDVSVINYAERLAAVYLFLITRNINDSVYLNPFDDPICKCCALGHHCSYIDPKKSMFNGDGQMLANLINLISIREFFENNIISRFYRIKTPVASNIVDMISAKGSRIDYVNSPGANFKDLAGVNVAVPYGFALSDRFQMLIDRRGEYSTLPISFFNTQLLDEITFLEQRGLKLPFYRR